MNEKYAYIGKMPCGCVVAAQIDDPNHKKEVGRHVARMIEGGLIIERAKIGDFTFTWDCPHQTDEQQQPLFEVQE